MKSLELPLGLGLLLAGAAHGHSLWAQSAIPDTAAVSALMRKVADYQAVKLPQSAWDNSWFQGTLIAGMLGAYRSLHENSRLDFAREWSAKAGWKLGTFSSRGWRNPDNHNCAQSYLEIYLLDPGARNDHMIADARAKTDEIIRTAKPGREEWIIADHAFMSGPLLPRLYKATGEAKYLRHLDNLYWDSHAWLFDKEDSIYAHDPAQARQRSKNGKKVYWGRGVGWTVGALARIIEHLPETHALRGDYVKVFRGQMNALRRLQDPGDGLWRTSLMDPAEFPQPEASCSAFFLYGMAWGINEGILDRAVYLPALIKGWTGLSGMVQADGRLCCIQPEAVAPGTVPNSTTAKVWYGSGIFLLAGEQMARLAKGGAAARPRRILGWNPEAGSSAYDALGRRPLPFGLLPVFSK